MERWEYRVVSLRDGTYTATLNEYGREGWELVTVAAQTQEAAAIPEARHKLPKPRALGRLEDAAAQLNKIGGNDPAEAPVAATSNLLWVLRRPLVDDDPSHPFDDQDAEFEAEVDPGFETEQFDSGI